VIRSGRCIAGKFVGVGLALGGGEPQTEGNPALE